MCGMRMTRNYQLSVFGGSKANNHNDYWSVKAIYNTALLCIVWRIQCENLCAKTCVLPLSIRVNRDIWLESASCPKCHN